MCQRFQKLLHKNFHIKIILNNFINYVFFVILLYWKRINPIIFDVLSNTVF